MKPPSSPPSDEYNRALMFMAEKNGEGLIFAIYTANKYVWPRRRNRSLWRLKDAVNQSCIYKRMLEKKL